MSEHHGARASDDSRREYLAGLNRHMGYRANRDHLDGDEPKSHIQQ
jgi:hypothetical protein